jgi:membrane protein YqaA with SNARE-associated domain
MHDVIEWIKGFALSLGGPGLFLLAFLDSSFLSFPEVCDFLVVLLTVEHPARMPYYAAVTTAGSVSGCFALYSLGLKGGEAFIRKRFHERHVERAMELFRRYGVLAIIVPSLLPPPMPFKIFVLATGVARMGRVEFLFAAAFGRALRYFGEGLLALWYGEQAAEFLRNNARELALWTAVAALVLGAGWFIWRSRRGRRTA